RGLTGRRHSITHPHPGLAAWAKEEPALRASASRTRASCSCGFLIVANTAFGIPSETRICYKVFMTSDQRELRGVLPVFQTPYHNDEALDYETLEAEIAWLSDCGANGFVMAMVSETLRLTS